VLLSEIELEDGRIAWLPGLQIHRSNAIVLIDELDEEEGWYRHQVVFDDKPLLNFLTRGEIDLFIYSDTYFPESTLRAVDQEGFCNWISTAFAKQFNLVLTRTLQRKAIIAVQAMLAGRRYVTESNGAACFLGPQIEIELDNLLQPLREAMRRSAEVVPTLQSVEAILAEIAPVLNLLPDRLSKWQTEAVRLIRSIAIACYNEHGETDLSQQILSTTRGFRFKSAGLKQQLDEDLRTVDKIIADERQYEVKLTQGGKPLEITRDSLVQGDKRIPAKEVASVRWGSILSGNVSARKLDVLLAFRSDRGIISKSLGRPRKT
jgi:hypothetical protein